MVPAVAQRLGGGVGLVESTVHEQIALDADLGVLEADVDARLGRPTLRACVPGRRAPAPCPDRPRSSRRTPRGGAGSASHGAVSSAASPTCRVGLGERGQVVPLDAVVEHPRPHRRDQVDPVARRRSTVRRSVSASGVCTKWIGRRDCQHPRAATSRPCGTAGTCTRCRRRCRRPGAESCVGSWPGATARRPSSGRCCHS